MLFQELDNVTRQIKALDHRQNWWALANELIRRDAPSYGRLSQRPADPNRAQTHNLGILTLGASYFQRLITPIPGLIAILREVLTAGSGPAHLRCAVAAALAYLVRQKDHIDDEAPAGYGYIDDAIIVLYTYVQYLKQVGPLPGFPGKALKQYQQELIQQVQSGLRLTPADVREDLRQTLADIDQAFSQLSHFPEQVLEKSIRKFITQPQDVDLRSAVPGFPSDQHQTADPDLLQLAVKAPAGGSVIPPGVPFH